MIETDSVILYIPSLCPGLVPTFSPFAWSQRICQFLDLRLRLQGRCDGRLHHPA